MGAVEARVMPGVQTEEVVVDLGSRAYPVLVGVGLRTAVGPRLAAAGFRGRAALLTSERVGRLYAAPVAQSLRDAGLEPTVIEVPDGEEHKNLTWLEVIYDRLLEARLDRRSPVVALGGGVIGDMAGFAAATLLRGLPVVQVPTTLLAQVDASIGGKTGVNHTLGKNLIGAFHQPCFVLADVDVLATLPKREFVSGLAEVVKYGVIGDAALFASLEAQLPTVLALAPEVLVPMVAACSRRKAAVVAADEREESGARAVLNFGHTVGHALETVTEYRQFLHGEAVAVGMVAATRVSRGLGLCGDAIMGRLVRLLERAGLPTALPRGLLPAALAVAMQSDKKSAGGRIRFVAVEDIGRTRFVDLTAAEIVQQL